MNGIYTRWLWLYYGNMLRWLFVVDIVFNLKSCDLHIPTANPRIERAVRMLRSDCHKSWWWAHGVPQTHVNFNNFDTDSLEYVRPLSSVSSQGPIYVLPWWLYDRRQSNKVSQNPQKISKYSIIKLFFSFQNKNLNIYNNNFTT